MKTETPETQWIAFDGPNRIAQGAPRETTYLVKDYFERHPGASILFFDAVTSKQVDIDLRIGAEHLERVLDYLVNPPVQSRTPGRPKLGVVPREVTLMPRHWEWLAAQQGGASVALRKLVEQAMRGSGHTVDKRTAQEAAYRFMTAMAGDERDYEEAIRALYADDRAKLEACIATWPGDVRTHVLSLVAAVFEPAGDDNS
jgi:uncharacterized protein